MSQLGMCNSNALAVYAGFGFYPSWDINLCSDGAGGVGGNTIYTVPAGKTLKVFGGCLSAINGGGAPYYTKIECYDGSSWITLIRLSVDAGGSENDNRTLWEPIEVPEGYTVRVNDENAAITSYGVINGYLI